MRSAQAPVHAQRRSTPQRMHQGPLGTPLLEGRRTGCRLDTATSILLVGPMACRRSNSITAPSSPQLRKDCNTVCVCVRVCTMGPGGGSVRWACGVSGRWAGCREFGAEGTHQAGRARMQACCTLVEDMMKQVHSGISCTPALLIGRDRTQPSV